MSRGLGRIERAILETLERRQRPMLARNLAEHVYDIVGEDGERDRFSDAGLSRGQLVAVRRAIKRLTERGLVESWLSRAIDSGQYGPAELVAQLPGTGEPRWHQRREIRRRGSLVRQAVLDAMTYFLSDPAGLKAMDEVREYRLYENGRYRGCVWPEGMVPYGKIRNRICDQWSITRYETWVDTAIHRAVHRLAKEGTLDISVEIRRDWRDRTTYQIIGCRLVLPCKNNDIQSNTYIESA